MRSSLLEVLRCPARSSEVVADRQRLVCTTCGGRFDVADGIPRMLDDRLPGIAEKRREIDAWPAKAREEAGTARTTRPISCSRRCPGTT